MFTTRLLLRGDDPGIRGTFRYLQQNSAAGAALARSSRVVAQSSSLRRLSRQRRGSGTGPAADAHRIKAGRGTEQAPVLPAELGGAVVADATADAGDVVRAVRQQQSRRLQPDVLLELDRAHRRHRLEVPVERGDAHPRKLRDF